jgi:cell fate (sporulation/competence/biofilm development) regulator YmcA (YheA/YmcA/DUF963 family)
VLEQLIADKTDELRKALQEGSKQKHYDDKRAYGIVSKHLAAALHELKTDPVLNPVT